MCNKTLHRFSHPYSQTSSPIINSSAFIQTPLFQSNTRAEDVKTHCCSSHAEDPRAPLNAEILLYPIHPVRAPICIKLQPIYIFLPPGHQAISGIKGLRTFHTMSNKKFLSPQLVLKSRSVISYVGMGMGLDKGDRPRAPRTICNKKFIFPSFALESSCPVELMGYVRALDVR
jgi:hypothetical protein